MNATISYKVTIPVQMNWQDETVTAERVIDLEGEGKRFIELALIGQDLAQRQDKERAKLGLINTLVPHIAPVVEILT